MMMKIIVLTISIGLIIWLNTYRVSYDFIREQNWKYYDLEMDRSDFGDVITFKNKRRIYGFKMDDKGLIYQNDTLLVGKIMSKKHDYINTYITVLDSHNNRVMYIAK